MDPFDYHQLVLDLNDDFTESMKSQNFPFRHPLIRYLLKNATFKILQKLYSCCKKFLVLEKIAICGNLTISSTIQESYYCEETDTLYLTPKYTKSKLSHKMFIYGKFKFLGQHENRQALSSFISKQLYRCEAYSFFAENQNISFEDFQFLLSKKTKHFILDSGEILYENNEIFKHVKEFHDLYTFRYGRWHVNRMSCRVLWRSIKKKRRDRRRHLH